MNAKLRFTMVMIAAAIPSTASAVTLQLAIDLPGDADQRVVKYQCEGEDNLRLVTYINADPNFLAVLTMDDKPFIMASTISGSGVQYSAGQYNWTTKGVEASLFDLSQGPNADAIANCFEVNDIP